MDFSMAPQIIPIDPALDSNPPFEYEWDALEKFLEWQQTQTQTSQLSSPSSLLSEPQTQAYQPYDTMLLTTPQDPAHQSWNNISDLSPESLSPMSSFSPPHSGPEVVHIKEEPSLISASKPQMPKVGRPRSTPVAEPGSYKTPTHARRRNQNREAQRAFRARQRQHLEELAAENKDLMSRNQELEERCEKLARAYERVLGERMDGVGSGKVRVNGNGNGNGNGAFGMPWHLVSSAK